METVLCETHGAVTLLTLNRLDKMNALNFAMTAAAILISVRRGLNVPIAESLEIERTEFARI